MNLSKFFNEQDTERHAGKLFWFKDMLPVRGDQKGRMPLMKQEELETSVRVSGDFRCQTFRLWKEEDQRLYTEVMDRTVAGWYRVLKQMHHFSEEHQEMMVYLEWIQRYGTLAPGTET